MNLSLSEFDRIELSKGKRRVTLTACKNGSVNAIASDFDENYWNVYLIDNISNEEVEEFVRIYLP